MTNKFCQEMLRLCRIW